MRNGDAPAAGDAPATHTRKRPWRRWMAVIHRDLGYLCVALTLIYAVSGLAVNHIRDWNPNYRVEREERRFEPVPVTDRDTMVRLVTERLALPSPEESFRPVPGTVELFYDGWSVTADAAEGVATIESVKKRFLLFEANALHLNRPQGLWTWIADAYALLLVALTLTGIFILKGKTGLAGRGKWFVLAGLAVPVVFLIVLRWL